ncbi:hypothetical protein DUI87_26852 [Hirundo rustica rustica]|uniref:HMG box domain-containing protein n=1 Tax=Hirundo rustica rustica TaxID=333673 RepID=A0A3M0JPP3_HIRRU|nr:hypothetical protein DUI87_26852 [Hirundo rustica rustica]
MRSLEELLVMLRSNKVPVVQPSHGVHPLTPLIPYSNDHFSHGSHSPHLPADINQKQGVHRPSQTSDIPGFYPLPPGGVGQITPSMGWFTHPLMLGSGMHTTGIPHPAIVPHSGKQEMEHYDRNMKPQPEPKREKEAKKPTIKKPLNAFMLYMKEMRAKVIAECTLKESAAINQILGRRWHALSREEQAKYYELARKERQLHMQLYPGWSARDNYGKKKRRTREKQQDSNSDLGMRKAKTGVKGSVPAEHSLPLSTVVLMSPVTPVTGVCADMAHSRVVQQGGGEGSTSRAKEHGPLEGLMVAQGIGQVELSSADVDGQKRQQTD